MPESNRRTGPNWLVISLALLAVLGMVALVGYFLAGGRPRKMGTPPVFGAKTGSVPFFRPHFLTNLGDTFNILLIGRDARLVGDPSQDGKKRNKRENVYHSDVLVIAHFNLPQRRVTLVNIPRDMLVEIPGISHPEDRQDFCNLDKITHATAYGKGDALAVKTVERFCGIRIRRRIAVDFDSFRLGYRLLRPFLGKMVFGSRELKDPDEALMFVRDRRHYPNDDIDRSRHSVLFVKTVIQRLWPKLSNKFTSWLLPQVLSLIGADTDLASDDVQYVMTELRTRRFAPDSIETAVLIGAGAPVTLWSYGQTLSCYIPNYGEIEKQVDYYLKDRRDVPAFSFMEQNQKIPWPGYCFDSYDFMPETVAVDTTSPAYRRFMMERDTLGASSLTRRDTGKARTLDALGEKDSVSPKPGTRESIIKVRPASPSSSKAKKARPDSVKPKAVPAKTTRK
jgi:anionic cell wall polymer biosynthesis LytR-Cps2A-Psr (LCP) family protein